MASSLSTLSSLLLNPYAQTAFNAGQAKQATDPIKPGATITARYTVGDDGDLLLRDVNVDSVNQGQEEAARKQQQRTSEESNRPSYTLGDISKPRATLSPSDEVSIFAALANQPLRLASPKPETQVNPNITDIALDDATPSAATISLAAQKQQQVAGLYARNLDITYNVDPIYSEAA